METIYRPRTAGSRIDPGSILRNLGQATQQTAQRAIDTFRRDPIWALWLLAWLPFWIGSVAPPPRWSWRRQALASPPLDDPAGAYLTARIDHLTRTVGIAWFVGALLRGIAIGLAAITAWAAIAALTPVSPPSPAIAIGVLGAGLALGAIHGWLVWPSRAQTVRMLDQTFGLRERMVSSFERTHTTNRISRIQLADAANTFDDIAPEIPRSTWVPVREVMLCLLLAGTLVTIILMGISSRPVAPLSAAPVPQFLQASERMAVREQPVQSPPVSDAPSDSQASIADIQERGRNSQQAREDLGTLGEALESYPVTKPAADAIASEQYDEAANLLRTAAESASTMNQAERNAMADDLDQAADQMSDDNPALAQATRDTAKALREGGPVAEEALNDLADQVEETGNSVESQESLAQELDQATGASGNTGQSQSSDQGTDGAENQGANQGQNGEQPGNEIGTDPGDGANANPGVVNQEQQTDSSSSSGSEQSNGSTSEGAGSAASDQGTGDTPANQGDATSGQSSSSSQTQSGTGDQQSSDGSQGDASAPSQGGGAGSSQTSSESPGDDSPGAPSSDQQQESDNAEQPGAGKAGDPPPGDGQSDGNTGTAPTSPGTTSLQLQGASDQSVQSGGSSGTASTGSGSDSTTASGDLASNNPGEAGPDSNRVPPSLRDIVRDYFDWPLP